MALPRGLRWARQCCPWAGGRAGHALHFFSWTSSAAVGGGIVEPRWLAWDPDVTLCALAYDDGVTLAAVRPQFKAIAALPIAHATSGFWHKHQLFLATPTAVVLVFAAAGGGGGRLVGLGGTGDPFVEVLRLGPPPHRAQGLGRGLGVHSLPALHCTTTPGNESDHAIHDGFCVCPIP